MTKKYIFILVLQEKLSDLKKLYEEYKEAEKKPEVFIDQYFIKKKKLTKILFSLNENTYVYSQEGNFLNAPEEAIDDHQNLHGKVRTSHRGS